jgi:hypothetical protein
VIRHAFRVKRPHSVRLMRHVPFVLLGSEQRNYRTAVSSSTRRTKPARSLFDRASVAGTHGNADRQNETRTKHCLPWQQTSPPVVHSLVSRLKCTRDPNVRSNSVKYNFTSAKDATIVLHWQGDRSSLHSECPATDLLPSPSTKWWRPDWVDSKPSGYPEVA